MQGMKLNSITLSCETGRIIDADERRDRSFSFTLYFEQNKIENIQPSTQYLFIFNNSCTNAYQAICNRALVRLI